MNKVEAVIQPYKLVEVKEALAGIGLTTLTVSTISISQLDDTFSIQNGKRATA